MTGQKWLSTGHSFALPVILTGHICMPSDRILNLKSSFLQRDYYALSV